MECPSLWQSTTFFQSNLSLNFALNSIGSNDRTANKARSKALDHDHIPLLATPCKVFPVCTTNADGTATPVKCEKKYTNLRAQNVYSHKFTKKV